MSNLKISILRFNPDVSKKPNMQTYSLNTMDCKGSMLLDGLITLKAKDESLSFRRSCGEGVCGSCAMNVNGKNGLACTTPLSQFKGGSVSIRPLPGIPIIRDLVVDLSQFYKQYESVQPYLQPKTPTPAKERLQSPAAREKLDGLYECILCGCCSSACPSYWWNPDKFLGPAANLMAARFIFDSRDGATTARFKQLEANYPLFRCRNIMNCVDVCPKKLNPTKAIGDIRRGLLDEGS